MEPSVGKMDGRWSPLGKLTAGPVSRLLLTAVSKMAMRELFGKSKGREAEEIVRFSSYVVCTFNSTSGCQKLCRKAAV